MDNHPISSTNAVSFCLLPSDLIQNILLHLSLPEIMAMKSVNKSIGSLISDKNFVRQINFRSKSTFWLFVYKKRWCRDAVLEGFSDQSTRWFTIAISDLLKPVVSPAEDLYFMTASANIFLFVSNAKRQVFAVNLVSKTVKKIPASPLGPRGTSSWRRSGMKLLAERDRFRFLFAEMVEDRPVLFEYSSETDTWRSMEAIEKTADGREGDGDCIFLNVINRASGSVVVGVGSQSAAVPVIIRPRLEVAAAADRPLQQHVYGDGHMMIISSSGAAVRKLCSIEVWGLSRNGADWEYICGVPGDMVRKMSKGGGSGGGGGYRVAMGWLEKAEGEVKIVLICNYECLWWQMFWLSYRIETNSWSCIQLPHCNIKGFNMAGIAFSRGLTLN